MNEPLLLGHRGHRCKQWPERENTIAAFDRALDAGCDGLELDLHLTLDGRVVVHHDAEVRLPGPTGTRRAPLREPIEGASLRALHRLLPDMPTLDQVLRRFRRRAWLDLEVKAPAVAEHLPELLRRWRPERGYVVSSFDVATLRHLAAQAPDLPLCLNLRRPARVRRLAQLSRELHCNWVAPHQSGCTAWYVRHLRRAGWRVLVWTVNRPAKMRMLARAGADVIVSDRPEVLVNILGHAETASSPAAS